ncbi:PspC domain-containing protein [Micromonospora sp. DT233]|uniref:PspC domain-containing protein n=1 Tax=Micromonospora sp. DT233 TaxID=3393432 RepID=UPI003CF0C778
MTEEAAPSPPTGAAQSAGPPPAGPKPATPADPFPPPGFEGYPPPPPAAAGFTSRYGLLRPREGRYLAGVCAAIGRATNTDPVLWRVLLAVLGFFGGIGILGYVAAWLLIPGEGDTASPLESMLGRGRSSMSPITVIVLTILAAVSFGYIVTDGFRAVLLGAAILVGGALLLNRSSSGPGAPTPAPPGPVPPTGATAPAPFAPPTGPAAAPGPAFPGTPSTATPAAHVSTAAWARSAVGTWAATAPAGPSAGPAAGTPSGPLPPVGVPGPGYPPVDAPRPPAGYRPPFAPHGPYAAGPRPAPPAPARPAGKPAKRPRERSPLGAATFSLVFLALGLVAVADLLNLAPVSPAAYFAAALGTIGLGLLVGAWFGRARWLIALGLVTSAALGVATVAESYDRIRGVDGNVTWAPTDHRDLADRYENNFGDAVLDLRGVDLDQRETMVILTVTFGTATVLVPPNVDVTTVADVNAGNATVFGNHSSELDGRLRESTDLGGDGAGGGKLRLYVHVNAGNLEVTR